MEKPDLSIQKYKTAFNVNLTKPFSTKPSTNVMATDE